MKILVKARLSIVPAIENFFVKTHGFQIVKNLIDPAKVESSSTLKFIILDIGNSYTNISMFNKVNEQKLKVIKIDLSEDAQEVALANCRILLEFPKTPIEIDAAGNNLFVSLGDKPVDNKALISNDIWYKFITYDNLPFPIFLARETLDAFPASKKLSGKTAFAILELNYSFCDDSDTSSKRDLFSSINVYSSKVIDDLFFAKIGDLIDQFKPQCVARDVYRELVSPAFNEKIKELRGSDDEICFIGLKDEKDRIVWLPLPIILQYMDMPLDIFMACIDKLQDKKTEMTYEIPSLDKFPNAMVNFLEIRLEKSTILFNFANILAMKEPAYNVTAQKFENMSDYEFYQD